ncbi:phenylalanyl-tRNA synthetase alpha subunit, mitochondrial [Tieghemiomyces parasiticus]|uniref:Phenylalanine--tRNA ligase, mitochondrial n=1 Tax=Tieghemiomyces parasiticus TaxID=78921 RepID=A0A9W7ZTG5_9FUNG|nr:phenylalanyl-tRNA synthetase alpha subunit, mitochondrial [Tieghemiomyces parasiticus]
MLLRACLTTCYIQPVRMLGGVRLTPASSRAFKAVSYRSQAAQPVASPTAQSGVSKTTAGSAPLQVLGQTFPTDAWTNLTPSIASKTDRKLHLIPGHPLGILKQLIFDQFPGYAYLDTLPPVVTTEANFDSLLIPTDHPSRSRHDAYYLNATTMLRSHTSAHQLEVLRDHGHRAFLVAADVYRRDEIDASHYPVFHQMEGVRAFSPTERADGTIQREIAAMQETIRRAGVTATEDNLVGQSDRAALQPEHTRQADEVYPVIDHLKTSLNYWVAGIFGRMARYHEATGRPDLAERLGTTDRIPVRWIEGNFPFTTPSWEMEVLYQGAWLEICGCGIMKQKIMDDAGLQDHIGWAAGFGLERLAMVLFDIPDIRLFWSEDPRFLGQFRPGTITQFAPFSKYPPCPKDISFWVPTRLASAGSDAATETGFHENDFMDLVREIAQDLVEDVKLVDRFAHPKTGQTSLCYRIVYRSMDRSVTNEEINELQERVRTRVAEQLGVTLR